MTDRDVVAAIGRLVPGVRSQFRGDECHALFLTKSDCLLGGLARRLSPADKREVLRLVSLLPHLRLLNLRRNRLGPVPDLGLERLEWLDLGSNYMGAVPDWLRRLPLQYLSLGVNELKFIPDWLGGLPLTTLKLHKNEIANVDAVRPLRALKFLNLYFNRIKPFPEFVFEFPNVRFFSWGVSGLERLPDGVGRWAELRWLSLVANRLTELPGRGLRPAAPDRAAAEQEPARAAARRHREPGDPPAPVPVQEPAAGAAGVVRPAAARQTELGPERVRGPAQT